MNLGPYAAYIVAAYVAGTAVIGGLIAWVLLDYRAQIRKLAELEARGVTRRSERPKHAVP